jgi:DUF4097 and DUF4098 domain-containing protein YvlB
LTAASRTWTQDAEIGSARKIAIRNVWGDIKLGASADGRLHVLAAIRAWGADELDAQSNLNKVRVTAGPSGETYDVRVEPEPSILPRRFRVDFDVKVPTGLGVEVAQARGDVEASTIGGDLVVSVASGDVTAQGVNGTASVEAAKGDVTVQRTAGEVRVDVKHGDVTLREVGGEVRVTTMHGEIELESVGGRVTAHTKNGDIALVRPSGPVALDLQSTRGDVSAVVDLFVTGSSSTISVMSGDISVQLGEQARCRISARTTSGDLKVDGPLGDVQRGRNSLDGVLGAAEAALEVSTVAGDVVVGVRRAADQAS